MKRGNLARAVLILLFLLPMTVGRKDPDTGRIRVLYVGDMIRPSPYPIMEAEPLIDVRVAWPVGPDLTDRSLPYAKKVFRQYIPRTYDILTESDVIIIDNPDVTIFEPKYLHWFRDSVTLEGSGFFMVGGNAAFGGRPNPSWGPTPVQDVLPVWCVNFGWLEIGRLKIFDHDDEFVSSLPLERRWDWMEVLGGNEIIVKEGAKLLAEYSDPMGWFTNPYWVVWEVGEGRSLAQSVDWTPAGGTLLMRWPYYGDYAVNLVIYLSKNPVPTDLDLLHMLRGMYLEYRSTRNYVFSVIDFGEKLGANMNQVYAVVEEADDQREESVEDYLGYEFAAAGELLELSLEELREASALAFKLKEQSMFWIFVIEWVTVTSTFALAGSVIWTLMVRRRLYREAKSTRFA